MRSTRIFAGVCSIAFLFPWVLERALFAQDTAAGPSAEPKAEPKTAKPTAEPKTTENPKIGVESSS